MSRTVVILGVLEIILLGCLFFVYLYPHCPEELKNPISYSFNGFSGALLLALRTTCSTCDNKPKEPSNE
jgi:hypothetical protein